MTMNTNRDAMIAAMTEELAPVQPFNPARGALLVGFAVLVTVLAVEFVDGLWRGILAGEAAPFFWVANGLLLVLGIASTAAVIAMSSPRVGGRNESPKWASAMIGVLPVAALVSVLPHADEGASLVDPYAYHCVTSALLSSLLVGSALVVWLRMGAPVSRTLAGWYTGLAAGALGAVAYGLSCPLDTVTHLGIWHVVPVAAAAIAGRLIVPHLIRW